MSCCSAAWSKMAPFRGEREATPALQNLLLSPCLELIMWPHLAIGKLGIVVFILISHVPSLETDSINMREKGWINIRGPSRRPATITLRGSFFHSSLLSLTGHCISQKEERGQCFTFQHQARSVCQNPPETTSCGTRLLGPRAPFFLGPLWHRMDFSLQALSGCPHAVVCSAVHSSADPGSQNENKRDYFGEGMPRDKTMACLFPNLPWVIIQKADAKEKRNQKRKHCSQESFETGGFLSLCK